MNTQQLFFYVVIAVCAIVFIRLLNQVIRMNVEEKSKAWLYIYLLSCLTAFAYITSRALNGFSNGRQIPMAVHGFLLLTTLCIYTFLIRRHMQQIIKKNNGISQLNSTKGKIM